MKVLTVAFILFVVLVGPAQASSARFYLKPGTTLTRALTYYRDGFNAQPNISGATCGVADGTPSTGWLHLRCNGRTMRDGAARRLTVLYTPLTCRTLRVRIAVAGVVSGTRDVGWAKDAPFVCHP